ncbi:MAG: tetratricopeptide repeat protein [Sinobacteraceae bacterium]|nr:tetratricopeptide repeat protein [Nevskiaceae bacterium]
MTRSGVANLTLGVTVGAGLLLVLSGCTTPPVPKPPSIGQTINENSTPDLDLKPAKAAEASTASKSPAQIQPQTQIKADVSSSQEAIKNYQALLELAPDPKVRAEARRRIADLQVQMEDLQGNPASGKTTLVKSIDTYRQLLAKHPNAKHNDRLLYQLSRAYENSGQTEQAIAALQKMQQAYPGSPLMGDAHFRSAQLLYRTRQYAAAAKQYQIVMDLGLDAPLYQPAQYKYGWSLFKQEKYPQAIAVFFKILDKTLPAGTLDDPDKALAQVNKGHIDMARDSLRVVSLSFAALGGGPAINQYYDKHGQPRFNELVYNALGAMFLKHKRYTDAAKTYTAFIKRNPEHADAPHFQDKAIAVYKTGGFNDQVLKATVQYANDYAPGSKYWDKKAPTKPVMEHLHGDLTAIGRHYQAQADHEKQAPKAQRDQDFAKAVHWYRRFLTTFPVDKDAPDVSLSLADSLYDGGQTRQAAYVYEKTAYAYRGYKKGPDAAFAAIQAWQRLATEVPPDQRDQALAMSVRSTKKLLEVYPDHPKRNVVQTQASLNLLTLKRYDDAVHTAQAVLDSSQPIKTPMQRTVLGVIGDAQFAQKNYPAAETAYTKLLKITPSGNAGRDKVVKQVALSIYRQGLAQQKLGNLRIAANHFLRIGKVVPNAKLRPTADYDAATAFIKLKDWAQAETVLEAFRTRFPDNKLIPDADKKLAYSYQSDDKPAKAAAVYKRIAQRDSESEDTRRDAAWLSAQLYDQARQPTQTRAAYQYYVSHFPAPLGHAMDARHRLMQLAKQRGDNADYKHWLKDIITADRAAGSQRTSKSRTMAADASLALARMSVDKALAIKLTQPLKNSLTAKKAAMEKAVDQLKATLGYGIAEDTTAATYALGHLYQNFAQSLIHSEPPNLSGDALDQYNLLLESKAEPFIEHAIDLHKANLKRVGDGLYDEWIARSVAALAKLAPGTYAKQEKGEAFYAHLH